MTWKNNDGLTVKFGQDANLQNLTGNLPSTGNRNLQEAKIKFDRLGAVGSEEVIDVLSGTELPKDALITKATLIVEEGFTSAGAATLTLGVEGIDPDGIDAAIAITAIDTVGEQVICDGALVGGVALTQSGKLTATVGTDVFTAGQGSLIVEYYVPAK